MKQRCDNCFYCSGEFVNFLESVVIDQKEEVYCEKWEQAFKKDHTCEDHSFRMVFDW